jgi:hypothetical protein
VEVAVQAPPLALEVLAVVVQVRQVRLTLVSLAELILAAAVAAEIGRLVEQGVKVALVLLFLNILLHLLQHLAVE